MPGRRLVTRLPEPVKQVLRPIRNLLPGERRQDGIRVAALKRMRATLATERVFGVEDGELLASVMGQADAVLPVGEAFDARHRPPRRLIALRHDTDRDIEGSVRFAEWEAGIGLRSTYFVLHTDWYWGPEGPRRPSAFVLRALDRIASLGHEIGVHNNAIAEALRTGRPPEAILEDVLAALRRHGFVIRGTASHGDPLARSLGFVNFELFEGCPNPDGRPADRTLLHADERTGRPRNLALRPIPMSSLGLEYEAYFIGQSAYVSDAGGTWHPSLDQTAAVVSRAPAFVELLAHPVLWDTSRPRPARGSPPPATGR